MTYEEFSARARQIYDDIPAEYREGVDGIEVTPKTVPHPSLPGIYTLGECLSELYPSQYGGAGEVLSRVVLYYGSFLELSRTSDDWDWEGELFETIVHEVRHHLEFLAEEDALEEQDYAEDQNFARREGERFDPFFFQAGNAVGPSAYEVGGDVFLERGIDRAAGQSEGAVPAEWDGRRFTVPIPAGMGDVHYVRLKDVEGMEGGDVYVVLVRKKGLGEVLRGVFWRAPLRVEESEVEAESA
jgi:predicted Zn-dependent protease with MMP-like domain